MRQILLFLFLILNTVSFAQSNAIQNADAEEKKEYSDEMHYQGLLLGVHGSQFPTLEIGYSKYYSSPENSKIPFGGGAGISIENYFLDDYMMAPKLSIWASAIAINFGASIPWYTNLKGDNSLKLRPEIGIGYQNWRVNFAYNLPVYNHRMTNVPDCMLSINYIIPFYKHW